MAHRGSKSKKFSISVLVRATSKVQEANARATPGAKKSPAKDDSKAKQVEAQMDGSEKQKEGTNNPTTQEMIVKDQRDVDMDEEESEPLADEDNNMDANNPDDEDQGTVEDDDQINIDEQDEESEQMVTSQQQYDEEEIIVVGRDSEPDDSYDEDFYPDEREARPSTRSSSRGVRVSQMEAANLNEFLPNPSASSRVFDKSLSGRRYGGKWGGARYLPNPQALVSTSH